MPPTSNPRVDLVIPVFNEEEGIDAFHQQLCQAVDGLPYLFTIIYVNDGSKDGTAEHLERIAAGDARVVVLELSRNFGHQAALSAGYDAAEGDFVISLDGDGQHPPALIAEMLRLAQSGYDIVLTQRLEQQNLSPFKKRTSTLFYSLINRIADTRIVPGSADFRLLSRAAADGLRSMGEYHRFLRGMVNWMGYKTIILPYQQPERLAGTSKYSFKKMIRLAMDAIFSFSLVPLYIGLSAGAVFFILALVEVIYVLSLWLSGNQAQLAPGWSSLMFVLLFVGGSIMVALGFMGVYIGYIFQQVKDRPVYLVRRKLPQNPPADVPAPPPDA